MWSGHCTFNVLLGCEKVMGKREALFVLFLLVSDFGGGCHAIRRQESPFLLVERNTDNIYSSSGIIKDFGGHDS